ncbi:hypothetical protein KUL17_18760 [Alteromonas sp. KUL17]|uniref:hypothetical protein n=1 Tax=Alteromonas sp. KUL17 TaxID=2480796 RepID=UPI00103700A1|nr:hypothetical protein [Alteromonas sp. KUL17]TAP26676.1 hypothetical protein KUL49_09310 [Alteromonas sp. KUL17]GEA02979.1 hypothetical protein KUL17_18760 [Alteromonas sp. KUL17]
MIDQQYINKYAECMEEIKKRTEVIRAFLDGRCNALYKQTTAESICLQVRKILELIALASLVANKEEYAKVRANFSKDWHAKRILKSVEEINPKFYPSPSTQIIDKVTGKVLEVKAIKSGFLTRKDFENIYDRCGGLLHAQNPFAATKDIDNFLKIVPSWLEKIKTLLNHHQAQLVQDDLQFWVVMQSKTEGRVQVTLFQRVSENA